jgi:hypothetical protein
VRPVFGPERENITGEWTGLHNEELYALYFLPNISQMIKSRRMRLAGHLACVGEEGT